MCPPSFCFLANAEEERGHTWVAPYIRSSMPTDHHHYEKAFETWLRRRRTPFVAIEQVRRSADREGPIKSFDFLVHAGRRHYVVDVKGRRFPTVSAGRETWWENWIHWDDLEGLFAWEQHFGESYEGLLVFCYWLQLPPPVTLPLENRGESRDGPGSGTCETGRCSASEREDRDGPRSGTVPIFSLDGRDYLMVAVPARVFAEHCRKRSARWKAVHVPEKVFTGIIRPVEFFVPGSPP